MGNYDWEWEREATEKRKKCYLSITQVAKYRNISTDTLRYYDKSGLLKPSYVDPDNNRRYYSVEKCEQLGTIRELREMNVPLKTIQEFMTNRNLNKSEEILRKHYEILKKEIEEKILLSEALKEKIDFIEQQKSAGFPIDIPQIRKIKQRYALYGVMNELSSTVTAVEFMKLEESMKGPSPILATNKVGMSISSSLQGGLHRERIRPVLFCTEAEAGLKNFQTIPSGLYIYAYHKNDKSNLGNIIERMRETAEKEGYCLGKEGYMIYQIDITLTDEQEETLVELQFPLLKKQ